MAKRQKCKFGKVSRGPRKGRCRLKRLPKKWRAKVRRVQRRRAAQRRPRMVTISTTPYMDRVMTPAQRAASARGESIDFTPEQSLRILYGDD